MITIEQMKDIVRDASKFMITDGFEIEQKGGCENIWLLSLLLLLAIK